MPALEELDSAPTLEELSKAVDALASGKAPGQDGIPPEVINEPQRSKCLSMFPIELIGVQKNP